MHFIVLQAWAVLKQLTLETLAVSFSSKSEAVCNSAASVLLSAVNSLIGENVGEVKGGDMAVVPGRGDLGTSLDM